MECHDLSMDSGQFLVSKPFPNLVRLDGQSKLYFPSNFFVEWNPDINALATGAPQEISLSTQSRCSSWCITLRQHIPSWCAKSQDSEPYDVLEESRYKLFRKDTALVGFLCSFFLSLFSFVPISTHVYICIYRLVLFPVSIEVYIWINTNQSLSYISQ